MVLCSGREGLVGIQEAIVNGRPHFFKAPGEHGPDYVFVNNVGCPKE
jgi:hypothetical protein